MSDIFSKSKLKLKIQERIHRHFGDNSPISNSKFPHTSKISAVVLNNQVYKTLKKIADITNKQNCEVPFLLFGFIDFENQQFVFNDIIVQYPTNSNTYEAVFSKYQNKKYAEYCINATKAEGKIAAHGHSHPRVGAWYLKYSLADVNAYIDMAFSDVAKNVGICGCLLTGGNFNFVFCDGVDVYRCDNVFAEDSNGEFIQLPCFGPDVLANTNENSMGR